MMPAAVPSFVIVVVLALMAASCREGSVTSVQIENDTEEIVTVRSCGRAPWDYVLGRSVCDVVHRPKRIDPGAVLDIRVTNRITTWFVVEEDGRRVGCLRLRFDEHSEMIEQVAVSAFVICPS